jgi:hypothetical protein
MAIDRLHNYVLGGRRLVVRAKGAPRPGPGGPLPPPPGGAAAGGGGGGGSLPPPPPGRPGVYLGDTRDALRHVGGGGSVDESRPAGRGVFGRVGMLWLGSRRLSKDSTNSTNSMASFLALVDTTTASPLPTKEQDVSAARPVPYRAGCQARRQQRIGEYCCGM